MRLPRTKCIIPPYREIIPSQPEQKMEKYNKDQNDLSKQLQTFGREWKRISRELDDVAVHWETRRKNCCQLLDYA